jgi:hypothetical protein
LVSTVTLTAPHKQIPVTRLSSAPLHCTVSIMPQGITAMERVYISGQLTADGRLDSFCRAA